MTENHATLQHEATSLGLATLASQSLTEFADARAAASRMLNGIPRDLPIDNEPAHTFRASEEA
jgi:hypothetical protein